VPSQGGFANELKFLLFDMTLLRMLNCDGEEGSSPNSLTNVNHHHRLGREAFAATTL